MEPNKRQKIGAKCWDMSTSPVVLVHIITMLQQELDASRRQLERAENIAEATQAVLHQTRMDLRDTVLTVQRLTNGSEIVCRALDEQYQYAKDMFTRGEMGLEHWNEFYRFMLRGDIGFAILNGADFVDLTAPDTPVDGDETETETEDFDESD